MIVYEDIELSPDQLEALYNGVGGGGLVYWHRPSERCLKITTTASKANVDAIIEGL